MRSSTVWFVLLSALASAAVSELSPLAGLSNTQQCGFLTKLDQVRADLAFDLVTKAGSGRQAECFNGKDWVSAENGLATKSLKPMPTPPVNGCQQLARAQAELAGLGTRITLRRAKILDEAKDTEETLTPADQQQVTCLENLLAVIAGAVEVPDSSHLFLGFDDYSDHFFGFHLGYEYAAINDVLGDSAHPRTGLLVTTRFRGKAPQERTGVGTRYGSQLILIAQLASSGEEAISLPGDDAESTRADDPGTDDPIDPPAAEAQQSLEFELAYFKPLYSSWATTKDGRRLKHMTGPIIAVGGRKTDGQEGADRRVYGGVRFALNPEFYGDILYGQTDSLRSRRVEIRGQLPLFQMAGGSRLYLGAIGNFGIDSERKQTLSPNGTVLLVEEPDSIRVYLSFETNLQGLFKF